MSSGTISFDDGSAYEQMMGTWSQLAGDVFVSWLASEPGLRWIDIGCGNGAFTQLLVDRCAPSEVYGIDPAEGQLVFARARSATQLARFSKGDAMALPFPDNRFDAAVMALVIFYAPDPARAVSEMVRVVKPGGTVSTYIWDILEGLSPTGPVQAEMQAMGVAPLSPPSLAASRMDALHSLWTQTGLDDIRSGEITVTRDFNSFDDFWTTNLLQPSIGKPVAAMTQIAQDQLKSRARGRLSIASDGHVSCSARANAITGRKPG
jgi:ubiquinone/menaquinone biosynthesis C-methylase UbiE